jgi:hypothetical protein
MTVALGGRNVPIGAAVTIVGGVLGALGVFLAWATISVGPALASTMGPAAGSTNGFGELAGKLALILSAGAVALGILWAMEKGFPNLELVIVVVGVAILVGVALAYFTSIITSGALKDELDLFNKGLDQLKAAGMDTSGTSAGLGIGFFLEIVAGIIVIVGGALGLMKKSA